MDQCREAVSGPKGGEGLVRTVYDDFCESLRVGKARAAEAEAEAQDEQHVFERAVAGVVRATRERFACPAQAAHYVDPQSRLPAMVPGDLPPLRFEPQTGRHALDLEIALHAGQGEPHDPIELPWGSCGCGTAKWKPTSGRGGSGCPNKRAPSSSRCHRPSTASYVQATAPARG